jgi:hypothetical protein
MLYEIDCTECGAQTVRRGMNESRKVNGVTHRQCACGNWTAQHFRTPPAGYVDAPSDSKPFQVYGMEGTFRSRKEMEAAAKAQNKDIAHTGDDSWKRTKYRAKEGAAALAKEMGYTSVEAYKSTMRDPVKAAEKLNETLERQHKPRA